MEIHAYIQSGNFVFRKVERYIRSNPEIIRYRVTSLYSQTEPLIVRLITDVAHQRAFTFNCLGIYAHRCQCNHGQQE